MEIKDFFFDTPELRLHGIQGPPAGPPLVLLHGATSNCHDWSGVIPHLAGRWHVYALDLRGHGLSGRPDGLEGYHIDHNIADVLAFLRGFVRQPAVLVGHSYGAVIAALAALPAADSLRAVVLEDPPLMLRRDNNQSKPFLDYFTWLYTLRQSAATVEEIMPLLAAENPARPNNSLRAWAQDLAWLDPNFPLSITTGSRRETVRGVDFEARIRGIACPVLVMQADQAKGAALLDEDLDFFMANARNAHLVKFPGSGHGIHNDQTAAFLRALDAFTAALP